MKIDNFPFRIQLVILNLIVFITIALIVIFGILFTKPFLAIPPWIDAVIYLKMSESPFNDGSKAPYKYRILTPLIVSLLPVDSLTGFIIVNLASLYATSILFFFYLKKLNFSFGVSVAGVLFFIFSPQTMILLQSIVFVDFLTLFLFLLAFYALLAKNNKLFLVSVTIGVANREIILIILILFFILQLENKEFKSSLKKTILFAIPPLTVYFLIRLIYGYTEYYLNDLYGMIEGGVNINLLFFLLFPYNFYYIFAMLWLISLLNYKKLNNDFLKKSVYLIPFIFLQLFLASNYARLFFIAFPIIIPISLYIYKIEIPNKTLILILLLTIACFIAHIIGTMYFFGKLGSLVTDFKSYIAWIILTSLFEVFIILNLIYLLLKKNYFNKSQIKDNTYTS